MAWQRWRYFCCILANICLISLVLCVTPSYSDNHVGDSYEPIGSLNVGEDTGTNGAFGLPGTQHEFRFEVGPGMEQCLFQHLQKGSQFHFTYQVLLQSTLI